MSIPFLKSLRHIEIEIILSEIKELGENNPLILEIGAGAGWQSQKISENGFRTEAIDLKSSNYKESKVWPITYYDGKTIPFPDKHFDAIFSSNVLEHIPHIIEFQNEILRVLKPNGIAIHILPSATWRLWTSISHYLYIPKMATIYLFDIFSMKKNNGSNHHNKIKHESLKKYSKFEIIRRTLMSPRHGEIGTALTEIYYFSAKRWQKLFKNSGWKIESTSTNNLFYTGNSIFGSMLSIKMRSAVSKILGSTCHVFVMKKNIKKNNMSPSRT